MSIKESALSAITSITQSDFVRAVTSAGASRRVTVANLAKAIIESYTGSSLAGSNQSIQSAVNLLNSKKAPIFIDVPANGSQSLTMNGNIGLLISSRGTSYQLEVVNFWGANSTKIASSGTERITISKNANSLDFTITNTQGGVTPVLLLG